MQHVAGPTQAPGSSLDFGVRLLRWRTMILVNTLIVAALAVIISLLLPNWYEAQVSVLPPQEEQLSLAALPRRIGSAMGAAGQVALGLSGGQSLPIWASQSDFLAGILRSRRLREPIIREHDLISLYKCGNIDQALKEFSHHINIRVGAEGIVRVRIEDQEPERAAAMSASCLRILDEIQRETRRSRAADVSRFVATRLATTERELAAAEDSLREFEEQHGLLAPEEQAAALVQTVAKVEAERIAACVERDALVAQVGRNHPEVQRAEALVRSLEQAKAGLEGHGAGHPAAAGPTVIIDLAELPALSLTHLRLLRNVEIRAVLFELLTQMLEQYRIQEVRDVATIEVLDPPAVPAEKVRPRRAVICVVATLLAFLLSLVLAVLLERMLVFAETDPERHAKLERLLGGLGLKFLLPRG